MIIRPRSHKDDLLPSKYRFLDSHPSVANRIVNIGLSNLESKSPDEHDIIQIKVTGTVS